MNRPSLVLVVAGFLIGGGIHAATGSDLVALLVCGTLFFVGDLAWRARSHGSLPVTRWLVSPAAGGVVFVFPVWTLGAAQLVGAAARALGA